MSKFRNLTDKSVSAHSSDDQDCFIKYIDRARYIATFDLEI